MRKRSSLLQIGLLIGAAGCEGTPSPVMIPEKSEVASSSADAKEGEASKKPPKILKKFTMGPKQTQ